MDLSRFIQLLPKGTRIRVKVAACNRTFSGETGPRKTDALLYDIYRNAKAEPTIYAIYPLYHAQELYIECW